MFKHTAVSVSPEKSVRILVNAGMLIIYDAGLRSRVGP